MWSIRHLPSVNSDFHRVCCAPLFTIFLLEIVDPTQRTEGQALGQFLSSFERLKKKRRRNAPVTVMRGKNRGRKMFAPKSTAGVVRVVIALLAMKLVKVVAWTQKSKKSVSGNLA